MNRIRNSRFVSTILIFIQNKVRPIHFWQTDYRLPDVGYRSPEAQYKAGRIPNRSCVSICNNLTSRYRKNGPDSLGKRVRFRLSSANLNTAFGGSRDPSDRTPPAPRPKASGPRAERPRSRSNLGARRREAQSGCQVPAALPSRTAGACRTPRHPRECPAG